MAISDELRARVAAWLLEHDRHCPICKAGPESLIPFDTKDDLHPDAAGPRGIDTSMTSWVVLVRCDECGFDRTQLRPEEVDL